MGAVKLQDHIYSVGVLNPSLRVFDIVMEARFGTSYNAYLITGEKNVLVETVHLDYFEEYLENINSVTDFSNIDYLIMNHTEPDHSGSVAKILELNPKIKVVCTQAAQRYLSAIANRDFECQMVKNGDKLDIGNGRELEFIIAPVSYTHLKRSLLMFKSFQRLWKSATILSTYSLGVTPASAALISIFWPCSSVPVRNITS